MSKAGKGNTENFKPVLKAGDFFYLAMDIPLQGTETGIRGGAAVTPAKCVDAPPWKGNRARPFKLIYQTNRGPFVCSVWANRIKILGEQKDKDGKLLKVVMIVKEGQGSPFADGSLEPNPFGFRTRKVYEIGPLIEPCEFSDYGWGPPEDWPL